MSTTEQDSPRGNPQDNPQADHDSQERTDRAPGRVRLQRLMRRSAAPLAALIAFGLGLWLGSPSGGPDGHGDHTHAAADQDTVWTCSMHPQIRQNEPGQCPICGMDLIPVSGAAGGQDLDPTRVSLSETARILARVRTAAVERRADPDRAIHLLGRIDYDETRIRTVTAWTGGRIDRLRVATTGQRIHAGQVIADLYSPELYSAHQDLIQARLQRERLAQGSDMARTAAEAALASARQRLRLLGIPDAQLADMERADRPSTGVPVRAPVAGTVIERLVSEGSYVSAGTGLYRVADLSRLWVQLDAYERDLAGLAAGTAVTLRVAAIPGESFEGRVAFVDPVVDARTRTARVRVEVANPQGRLKPGMFAEAVLQGGARDRGGQDAGGKDSRGQDAHPAHALVIPDTAPLFTGRRSLVYVEVPGMDRPTYEAREVKLGPRAGTVYPVLAGLAEGERVVIHGAFTLDADLQIRGGHSMMTRGDDTTPGAYELALDVPDDARQALAPALDAYLAVQEALAGDDLAAARDAAARLGQALDAVTLPGAAPLRDAWQALGPGLRQHAGQVAAAAEIEAARRTFEHLSEQVVILLQRFGNPLDTPLRVAFCPMALDGKGARWVQQRDTVFNSYYGASMLACGELRNTVEAGQHLPGAAAAGAGTAGARGGHSH